MSTLNSASTLADIRNAYADNASYWEDNDAGKAAAFVTACMLLLNRVPSRSSSGGGVEIEIDVTQIKSELDAARRWLATRSTAGAVRARSFENLR